MTQRLLWLFLALPLCGSFVACIPVLVEPTLDDVALARARWPEITLESLHEGRALYVRKCAGCHALHRPEEYPADDWNGLITQMIEKQDVELEPHERDGIERYLVTASLRLHTPEPLMSASSADPPPDEP